MIYLNLRCILKWDWEGWSSLELSNSLIIHSILNIHRRMHSQPPSKILVTFLQVKFTSVSIYNLVNWYFQSHINEGPVSLNVKITSNFNHFKYFSVVSHKLKKSNNMCWTIKLYHQCQLCLSQFLQNIYNLNIKNYFSWALWIQLVSLCTTCSSL